MDSPEPDALEVARSEYREAAAATDVALRDCLAEGCSPELLRRLFDAQADADAKLSIYMDELRKHLRSTAHTAG